MTEHLALIVEGPGDAAAVPLLLAKIFASLDLPVPSFGKPVSCAGRDRALRPAAVSRPGCRGLLIVLDGEGDPVCQLGPTLLARAAAATDLPVVVGLADEKYESWLFASAETMRLEGLSYRGGGVEPVAEIRRRLGNRKYVKPTWQPRLTERIDVGLAAGRSPSLRRLMTRVAELAEASNPSATS
jgi:hypothetical protein